MHTDTHITQKYTFLTVKLHVYKIFRLSIVQS